MAKVFAYMYKQRKQKNFLLYYKKFHTGLGTETFSQVLIGRLRVNHKQSNRPIYRCSTLLYKELNVINLLKRQKEPFPCHSIKG